MAQGQSQCVRRVVRPGDSLQLQKPLRHVHHLALLRLAVARYRQLHLGGRVLVQRDAALLGGVQDDAPSVGHGDAGRDVGVEEQFLDGDDVGLQLPDQVLHVRADLVQTPGKGQARRGGNGSVGHHMDLSPVRLHQAEADGGKAGVDTQDTHGTPLSIQHI